MVPLVVAVATFVTPVQAEDASPFTITPTVVDAGGVKTLSLAVTVPKQHHLYADELSFELAGQAVSFTLPKPEQVKDKFSSAVKPMFVTNFTATLTLPKNVAAVQPLVINLHGCSEEECYFPETRQWAIHPDLTIARVEEPAETNTLAAAGPITAGFQVANRATGYLATKEFLGFLNPSSAAAATGGAFAGFGTVATIGLILLGGLALNLTPCVLPMIPINLAILGAGTGNGNKRRGFLLGITYGSGMAAAYGGLGLAVVMTGAKFGTLNSSPWFNFAIAVVFCVLGLAMFDKLAIDFSRFSGSGVSGPKTSRKGLGAFVGAAGMGGLSALLAGACVAPVVISVLLLATTSYQHGNIFGLLFPFVLGLGMALPWPFAASGLSFLPKPGMWMTRVKYGFGVVIFAFAMWYGYLGWTLGGFGQTMVATARTTGVGDLKAALEESRKSGKPVLVDFYASWCKNCSAMEHTTMQNADVQSRLKDYIVVKFQADRLNDPLIKPVLDELGVMGLPTYVLLHAQPPQTAQASPPAPASHN